MKGTAVTTSTLDLAFFEATRLDLLDAGRGEHSREAILELFAEATDAMVEDKWAETTPIKVSELTAIKDPFGPTYKGYELIFEGKASRVQGYIYTVLMNNLLGQFGVELEQYIPNLAGGAEVYAFVVNEANSTAIPEPALVQAALDLSIRIYAYASAHRHQY